MTEFYVRPESVATFASTVEGLGDGVPTAKEYLSTWGSVSGGEDGWIFFTFSSAAQDLLAGARSALNHLSTVVSQSAAELTDTANHYATADTAEAAALDKTYPGAPS